MLHQLHTALEQLPKLLDQAWESLDINYHPPRVERLFRAFGEGRLYLHRIHPCRPDQALFHPHPWPCAIRVLSGTYEMGMGSGGSKAKVVTRLVTDEPLEYEMTHPDARHYVRPIGRPALSVMVTGRPWKRPSRAKPRLGPLSDEAASALLEDVRLLFRSGIEAT